MKRLLQHLLRFSGHHISLPKQLILIGLFESASLLTMLHLHRLSHPVVTVSCSLLMRNQGARVEPLPVWYRWLWEEDLVEETLVAMDGAIHQCWYFPTDDETLAELLPAYHPYRDTLLTLEQQVQQFWHMGTKVRLVEIEAVERQLDHLLMSVERKNQ
jgi:hypothetical protein